MRLAVHIPSCLRLGLRRNLITACPRLLTSSHLPSRFARSLVSSQSQTVSDYSIPPIQPSRALPRKAAGNDASHGSIVPLSRPALPFACPGCGALAQTVEPQEAGYFSLSGQPVKNQANTHTSKNKAAEDEVVKRSLGRVGGNLAKTLGLDNDKVDTAQRDTSDDQTLICDRCHNLIHHNTGVPIVHPSVQSIEEIISESPYNHNHVYHVLDAADFPMSLIPNLQHHLSLSEQRSKNRRSKSERYVGGRKADMSFIITRADLFAPLKTQVDSLHPYLVQVLRDAMGSRGKHVRLGNVRCVSSKRGWWTKEIKNDVWRRGNGCWLVGKVNVGKSNLFQLIFPKDGNKDVNVDRLRSEAARTAAQVNYTGDIDSKSTHGGSAELPDDFEANNDSLLPPAQPETAYPVMPIVSALPGTTASPIRVPFGGGRGELIDLPGLHRTDLDTYVRPEHKLDLVMKSRINPQQQVIKPGNSLLLGGLIRITPTTPDVIFLAYAFVPLKVHRTSTQKAISLQTVDRDSGLPTIRRKGLRRSIACAGRFKLAWDVTKRRTGPLTSASAGKLKPEDLPFQVFAADILIESCGWVEVVAQVRRKKKHDNSEAMDTSEQKPQADNDTDVANFPEVEVFSPEGKFISVRRPMNAWLLAGKTRISQRKKKGRPRKSMKSAKGRR